MTPAHALTFTAEAEIEIGLAERLRQLALPAGISTNLFEPHPDHAAVPFFRDGPPPAAIVEFGGERDALAALARGEALRDALGEAAWLAGLFRIEREAVRGTVEPRAAALSFVVRYYGPTANPAHFAAHYVANHPPILARFPKIRNVLCYVPLGAPDGYVADPCIIRNEVVFDAVPDLLAALHSDVLADLRADSKTFAPFGRSTHHAMRRGRLR